MFAEKSEAAYAGPGEASPPSALRPPVGFRAEITAPSQEEEEVTLLWRELETMRSKRDLSVIELTHLEKVGTTP